MTLVIAELSQIGNDSKVKLPNGQFLKGIVEVVAIAKIDEITTINVKLANASVEFEGVVSYFAAHPLTGQVKTLQSLVFNDGEEINFNELGEVTSP